MVSRMRWAALTWLAVARLVAPLRLGTPLPSVAVSVYWPEPLQDEGQSPGCDPEGYWRNLFAATRDHPWKTASEDNATLSMKCMKFNEATYLALPRRRAGQFYVFWGITSPPYRFWAPLIRERPDFIFTHYDRREHDGNFAQPRPGVTTAPVARNFLEFDPATPPAYFLTFKGSLNHGQNGIDKETRARLADDFMHHAGWAGEVVFETKEGSHDYRQLMNSAYVMVPSGHGRWSYRLSEALLSCAIPVILAPGLTLPYEDLIDWRSFAIIADSALGSNDTGDALVFNALQDPEKLLRLLPREPEVIAQRRQKACDVGHAYLSSAHARFESLLQSAAVYSGLLDATAVRDARVPPCLSGEIRFVPKKLRGAGDVHSARIARIEFMYDGNLVDMQQANVSDDQEDPGAINVRFGNATKLHYFRFYTDSDHEDLDPIQWEVLTVARSGPGKEEWRLHQNADDTKTPSARNSPTRWFRLVQGARLG